MNASKRTALYNWTMIVAVIVALVLATILTIGVITQGQVDAWLSNLAYAVAVIGQGVAIVAGWVAKTHVTPDE